MSAVICIICLVPFSEELEIVSLKCCHCFHRECINEWFRYVFCHRDMNSRNHSTCPQCRTEVNTLLMKKVILNFKPNEPHEDVIESQVAKIKDLEQQLKSKE